MKKVATILLMLNLSIILAKGQTPVITLTSPSSFLLYKLTLKANANNTPIQVDHYNDGLQLLDFTIDTVEKEIQFYGMSQTIKIYGPVVFLRCSMYQLTALDVSQNPYLTYLDCTINQLQSLDVTKNTALTALLCGVNQLSTLDLTKNLKLTDLDCSSNRLSKLNVTQNTALTSLWCGSNQLDSLDISKNSKLSLLETRTNKQTFSTLPTVKPLFLKFNQIACTAK